MRAEQGREGERRQLKACSTPIRILCCLLCCGRLQEIALCSPRQPQHNLFKSPKVGPSVSRPVRASCFAERTAGCAERSKPAQVRFFARQKITIPVLNLRFLAITLLRGGITIYESDNHSLHSARSLFRDLKFAIPCTIAAATTTTILRLTNHSSRSLCFHYLITKINILTLSCIHVSKLHYVVV